MVQITAKDAIIFIQARNKNIKIKYMEENLNIPLILNEIVSINKEINTFIEKENTDRYFDFECDYHLTTEECKVVEDYYKLICGFNCYHTTRYHTFKGDITTIRFVIDYAPLETNEDLFEAQYPTLYTKIQKFLESEMNTKIDVDSYLKTQFELDCLKNNNFYGLDIVKARYFDLMDVFEKNYHVNDFIIHHCITLAVSAIRMFIKCNQLKNYDIWETKLEEYRNKESDYVFCVIKTIQEKMKELLDVCNDCDGGTIQEIESKCLELAVASLEYAEGLN